jgi:hypothetical protein
MFFSIGCVTVRSNSSASKDSVNVASCAATVVAVAACEDGADPAAEAEAADAPPALAEPPGLAEAP